MPLTDTAVRNAKPKTKPFKLSDEKGLFLQIMPAGGKWWRFKYRFGGKEKLLALGVYPDVGLAKARERRDEARTLIADGIDPGEKRKTDKATEAANRSNTFESVAREWLTKTIPQWVPSYSKGVVQRMERDIFPCIGKKPISEVTPGGLMEALQRIENRGAIETARRLLQVCGQVFRYAVATKRAASDPTRDLRGQLAKPPKQEHHASITKPKAIGQLLRAIEDYDGFFVTKCALRLAPLVFVRPGELRRAEWSEIDLEAAEGPEWRIPAERMKMRTVHIVPLSRQAVAILKELHQLTGGGKYLFPSVRTNTRPMSENTVNAALRRLGYTKEEMTGHGFRSMASTRLNEMGWHRDAIERQLAHAERSKVRAAYNYAEHLPERRKMMQAWADYLEGLRKGAEVIPFRREVS